MGPRLSGGEVKTSRPQGLDGVGNMRKSMSERLVGLLAVICKLPLIWWLCQERRVWEYWLAGQHSKGIIMVTYDVF